jgi:hypothetical protein
MRWIVAVLVAVVALPAARVGAGPLGTQIPAQCQAQGPLDDGVDLTDDYRCAGIAIEFHTGGVAYSPGPIWAGQWLFTDEAGQFRAGTCVFKSGYLAWRYGETRDDLTAAGMWAVMHYYAQDAAGTRRAKDPTAPLIPSLDMIAAASGRDDLQAMAVALDAEAARAIGPWQLAVSVDDAGTVAARLSAGESPLASLPVSFLLAGRDEPLDAMTEEDGVATVSAGLAGPVTVVATAPQPGPALVYQGLPAGRHREGGQHLVTGGPVQPLTATFSPPTTTIPDTTLPDTTAATTTTTTTTTIPPTTIAAPVESTVPVTIEVLAPTPGSPLPTTGRGSTSIASVATMLLVAGIGICGAVSRRPRRRGPSRLGA